ncbi:MAG TPA: POTRA domain-containing protein [Puia sp.]|nr:POTRA domain-containing protein [Puia sp.]
MWKVKKYCFVILLILPFCGAFGQLPASNDSLRGFAIKNNPDSVPEISGNNQFIIGDIFINGNRITKRYIIERELSFKKGDTVYMKELVKSFSEAKVHLINTRLFNDVVISLRGFRGFIIDIQIDLKERWYIFPLPYVRPVDRNFTAWAEKNYSLSRLDYGLRYSQYNFTGRNDYLRVWLITGYSNQVELAYDLPYADKTLKHGFGFGFLYTGLKELNALTVNNQQFFINTDTIPYAGKYMREQLSFSLRYYFRPAIKTRHFFRFSLNRLNIDSAVTVVNPHYFNNNITKVFYPELSYVLNYNNVDYVPYPLKGFLFETGFLKRGINADMNLWQLYIKTNEGVPLFRKTYFVSQNMAMIRLPFDQPFYNQQLLGYGDFYMRGFEKYVVDGAAGGVVRNSLLRELFNFSIPFIRGTSHDLIPVRIYAKTYFDMGYAYNSNFLSNSLVNQMLYSGGVGIDIVTLYDFVFRFEYSINQLGEKGLFFHIRNDF